MQPSSNCSFPSNNANINFSTEPSLFIISLFATDTLRLVLLNFRLLKLSIVETPSTTQNAFISINLSSNPYIVSENDTVLFNEKSNFSISS